MRGVGVEEHLRAARDAGRKLLVPYVTGGITDDWVDILLSMVEAGADAVEVGLPFSDPMMDGPTIQQASLVSLKAGSTPQSILAALREVEVPVPLVVMTYGNLVFRAGVERFAHDLAGAGVRGAIVPDVPLEEVDDWQKAAFGEQVETVLLAAPVTTDERLVRICERSSGFIYGVNLMGVTGERTEVSESSHVLAKRLKSVTDKPVIMGFGISTPEQASDAATEADGVVVASALMRSLMDGAGADRIGSEVAAFRAALDKG